MQFVDRTIAKIQYDLDCIARTSSFNEILNMSLPAFGTAIVETVNKVNGRMISEENDSQARQDKVTIASAHMPFDIRASSITK